MEMKEILRLAMKGIEYEMQEIEYKIAFGERLLTLNSGNTQKCEKIYKGIDHYTNELYNLNAKYNELRDKEFEIEFAD